MSAAGYLARYAVDFGEQTLARLGTLEQERAKLLLKLSRLDDEIAIVRDAVDRASIYPIQRNLQCPVCWINGKNALVHVVGRGTSQHDLFRCSACDTDFKVPFG